LPAGQHDAEDQQHRHAADVHENLNHAEEIRAHQEIQARHRDEHGDEPVRHPHDVRAQQNRHSGEHRQGGKENEDRRFEHYSSRSR
jgi:hypothetical protein